MQIAPIPNRLYFAHSSGSGAVDCQIFCCVRLGEDAVTIRVEINVQPHVHCC